MKTHYIKVQNIYEICVDFPKNPTPETLTYAAKTLTNVLGKDSVIDLVNFDKNFNNDDSSEPKRSSFTEEETFGCLYVIYKCLGESAEEFMKTLKKIVS